MMDPLGYELGPSVGALTVSGRDSTFSGATRLLVEALWYMTRVPTCQAPWQCGDCGVMRRPDDCIDAVLERFGRSARARVVMYSDKRHKRVYALDRPFGELDDRIRGLVGASLLIKEYYRPSGEPDTEYVERYGQLCRDLYLSGGSDPSLPLVDVSARTHRRIVSVVHGENVAYEYAPRQRATHPALARSVDDAASRLGAVVAAHPSCALAARDEYTPKLVSAFSTLADYLPPAQARSLRRVATEDAALLAGYLADAVFVPHVDPVAHNLTWDGRMRFVDIDPDRLVSRRHQRAQVWCDPSYALTTVERLDGLGDAPEVAFSYLARRVARHIARRSRGMPLWESLRVEGSVRSAVLLSHVAGLLRERLVSARAIASLRIADVARAVRGR